MALTIVLYFLVVVLVMQFGNTTNDSLPVAVQLFALVALAFALPLLYPAALILENIGCYEPILIYGIVLIFNSALMAWLITWFIMRRRNQRSRNGSTHAQNPRQL